MLPASHSRLPVTAEHVERHMGVVVAGTFDRLHEGHKLLLATAFSMVADRGTLVVGITDGEMIKRKELFELIQPYDERAAAVEAFLLSLPDAQSNKQGNDEEEKTRQKKNFTLTLSPITDPVPARGATDPSFTCLVVSAETVKGAMALNAARKRNGVPAMEVVVIDTLADHDSHGKEEEEQKVSSSKLRRKLLGTFLTSPIPRERVPRCHLSCPPYVVGLTGGIASGKSSVRKLLESMGASVLDCDSLAHKAYLPHTPTHKALLEAFGSTIVNADGTINRASLATLVFSSPDRMRQLTSIVWPAVALLVAEHREALSEGGDCPVLVCEASLMVEARSYRDVDEMWVVFCGQETSKKRLMARNGLSEDEAEARMAAQVATCDRLRLADVAIYNEGDLADTRRQVEVAWNLLQERLRAPEVARWHNPAVPRHPLWARWSGLMVRLHVQESTAVAWWLVLEEADGTGRSKCHGLSYVCQLYHLYHDFCSLCPAMLISSLSQQWCSSACFSTASVALNS